VAQQTGSEGNRGGVLATIASLTSLVAALSCCLPIGTLLMAAGSATASIVSEKLRPWLLAVSVGCLVLAFVQTYFVRRCEFGRRRLRTSLLWLSAVLVVSMLAFPRFTSTLFAGRLLSFTATSTFRDFDEQVFIREFNAASDKTRLVVLLSPT
jgi:hypothetical protein